VIRAPSLASSCNSWRLLDALRFGRTELLLMMSDNCMTGALSIHICLFRGAAVTYRRPAEMAARPLASLVPAGIDPAHIAVTALVYDIEASVAAIAEKYELVAGEVQLHDRLTH
jgi:hypothetical protein